MSCFQLLRSFQCVYNKKFICLHPIEISYGIQDCEFGEDEYLCELPDKCPNNCQSLMYSIYCRNVEFLLLNTTLINSAIFLKLINVTSNILDKGSIVQTGNSLVALIWMSSFLNKMCFTNLFSASVQLIDFSYNQLETLESFCFSNESNLKVMLLSHNKLRYLAPIRLKKLIKLDLSYYRILDISSKPFRDLQLIILNISFNMFTKINIALHRYLLVNMVLTEDYRICCLMSSTNTICSTKPMWPQSCEIIFNTLISKVIIIFEFTSIILFNTFSFFSTIFQSKIRKSKHISKGNFSTTKSKIRYSTFSIHTMLLNLNDIFFGIYLAFIFIADQYYGESYVINASNWLGSIYCRFLGFVSTFSLLNSLYFLNMLTISRMFVVYFPLEHYFKNTKTMFRYLLIGTTCNLAISIVVMCSYHSFEQRLEMPSSICLYFGENHSSHTLVITTVSLVLLQLGSFVLVATLYTIRYLLIGTTCNLAISIVVMCSYHSFEQRLKMPSSICLYFGENHSSHTLVITTVSLVLLQLGSFVLVTTLYTIIQKKVITSIEAISQNNLLNSKVLSQSILVTITNAVCWLPSSAVFITSLVLETYPTELLLWNIILINPINSVINPIIFCIAPTIRSLCKSNFYC